MTETQKRIQELKKAVPMVKEKVVAVASLFAISLMMMASATYAWVTLSRNPELGGVSTTVSANGNLEIALSDFDGKAPDPSGINDSFSAQNQTPHGANTSWGNLINLSSGYGLDKLVLRPATLNTSYPAWLTGVKYGEDGRVQGSATDYAFTTWGTEKDTGNNAFLWSADNNYGVRAISSVGYPPGAGQTVQQQALKNADQLRNDAIALYMALFKNKNYVTALEDLVSDFAQSKLSGPADFDCNNGSVEQLCLLMDDFHTAIVKYGEALVELANAQIKFSETSTDKTLYTLDTLMAASTAELNARGVDLGNCSRHSSQNCLYLYKTLKNSIKDKHSQLVDVYNNAGNLDIKWSKISGIVNALINVDKVKIAGYTAAELSADMGNALDLILSGSGAKPVVIPEGTIRDFELLTGARVNDPNNKDIGVVTVSVSKEVFVFPVPVSITGKLQTDLTDTVPPCFETAETITKEKCDAGEYQGELVALDTYGMVLDLWVRTNAAGKDGAGSILTLDGLPKIETRQERRMFLPSGKSESVPVFSYARPLPGLVGEGDDILGDLGGLGGQSTEEILVYKAKAEDGNEYYFNCATGNMVYQAVKNEDGTVENKLDADGNPIPLTDSDVKEKWDTIKTVVGFESSNRVWKDGELVLDSDELSATQGSGSCYVFYADSPEESASALELLEHFRLAFISAGGSLLASAYMDVEHVFAENGKYTVPLVVEANSLETTTNSGDVVYGITQLQQNQATRISVVVYLDGMNLENDMVMSNESIVGSLNLQFAVTDDLHAMKNEDLSMQTIALSADITEFSFAYNGSAHTPELTAVVEGISPGTVQAVFQRRINATQGTQMEAIKLDNTSGDVWNGTCSFVKPGTYVLNSLLIDGVEYSLPQTEWITVTVSGFDVGRVSFCEAQGEDLVLTTDRSVSRSVAVSFGVPVDEQPSKVGARFAYKENSEDTNVRYISATLTYDAKDDIWRGTADFTASGIYTLQFLVLDDEYFELDEGKQKSMTAYLGLQAQVRLLREGGLSFDFTGEEQVRIVANILTDTDQALKNMQDVKLYYAKQGSSLAENGLASVLHWNGEAYEGVFSVENPGRYVFLKMDVGNNVLTSATSASVITCRSTDPPVLNAVLSKQEQIIHSISGVEAYYAVQLSEVDGADGVWVVYEGVNDPIPFVSGSDGEYHFPFPTNQHGNQNGVWTVKEIRVKGVYDAAGNFYGDGEDAKEPYYILDPTADGALTTFTVIDEIDIKVDSGVTLDGVFMQEHDLPENFGVTVDVKGFEAHGGFENATGLEIGNVQLSLKHQGGSSMEYGGYNLPLNYTSPSILCETGEVGAAGKFQMINSQKLRVAGKYGSEVTVVLEDADTHESVASYILDNSTSTAVTVKSAIPTVKITEISPTGSIEADVDGKHQTVTVPAFTDNKATVYFSCKKGSTGGCRPQETHTYTRPTVTIELFNMGEATDATLDFGSVSFNWSANGECQRNIGSLSNSNQTKTTIGTVTANSLVLTYRTGTYSISVNVIIENPF